MNTNLDINDLQAIANILDIVAQRGGFRAQELSSVGALYDKIVQIIDSDTKRNTDSQSVLSFCQ